MSKFNGKVVLITGAGSGIGRAAALAFAREGAKLVLGNRNADAGTQVVSEIKAAGGEATFRRTDVLVEKDVAALVDLAAGTYGRLDVAFNNAGVEGTLAPLTEQTDENFRTVFDVNVRGVWLSMKYEIPVMLRTGGGSVINNSSIAGSIGFAGASIYVASKHAVLGLTRTAALEYSKSGVRVNAVSPAAIDTPMLDRFTGNSPETKEGFGGMHPIGRYGKPEEIAKAVLFLASDDASFVTGHDLLVDGGYTAQ